MVKKAVVLVAGYEPKLSPYTDKMHQCLFNLGKSTILEDMINKLSRCGIKEIILIVGHKKELIKEALKDKFPEISIKYVENNKYTNTRTSYSLYLAKEGINDDFILVDGDLITEFDLLKAFIDAPQKNMIAVDYSTTQIDKEIAVAKILNGKITEIGKHIQNQDDDNHARFLGISKFDKKTAAKILEQIDIFVKKRQYNKIYEDALNNILEDNDIHVFNTRKYNWFEIDEISQFENARKIYGDTEGLKQKAYELGADEVYITLPAELIFDERARLQCLNCKNYGKKHTCPPHIEDLDFEKLMKKYKKGLFVLVRMDSSKDFQKARADSTNKLHQLLLKLEKEAFTQDNHFTTTFIGGSCKMCPQGCAQGSCRCPEMSRIPLEATGVDVIETMKKFGVELTFPATNYINRVGLLLIG